MRSVERTVGELAAWRKARLDEHRAEWERSTNPYYVWEAVDHCPRDEPLPDWICDYLTRCNSKLKDLPFHGAASEYCLQELRQNVSPRL